MTNFIASDSFVRIDLASNDRLYVPQDVLLATVDHSVYAQTNATSTRIIVEGSVISLSTIAVYLNKSAGNVGSNLLTIGQTGNVRSLEDSAIYLQGTSNILQNWGEVSGRFSGAYLSGGDYNQIENHGNFAGLLSRGIYLDSSESVSIFNSGLITGSGGIEGWQSSCSITNSGTIQSTTSLQAIQMGAAVAGVSIWNSGTISSSITAIRASAHNDKVINSGEIIGDVQLNTGNDIYRASASGVVFGDVFGDAGADKMWGAAADDVFFGGDGMDNLRGRAGDDTLSGDNGNDTIRGGNGEDEIKGGKGADTLYGGDQDDVLNGQAGNDWLNGGRGDDILTGAIGADTFAFNRDIITDFKNGVDKIDLSAFGLKPADYATIVAPALTNAGGGATFLDLGVLGGQGSVLIEGLGFAQADAGDFIL